MIVQWLANSFYSVITGLLNWINLPTISSLNDVYAYINLIITNGVDIVKWIIPNNVFTVGFPILIAIVLFKYGYFLVMWILKKIPMASIH